MTAERWLGPILIAVGVAFLALAVLYLTVKAQSLPPLLGFIPESDVIRWKRGLFSLIVSLVSLFFGVRQWEARHRRR
jgi:hypothetical protein